LIMLSFIMYFFLTQKNNKQLRQERAVLILKNDSLHLLQLKTKNELVLSRRRFDSLAKKKYNASFTFKKRT
jgi:hypothetical protein